MSERTKPMNLGELIDTLSECTAERVRIASPIPLTPCAVSSYRGYYDDLAIEFDHGHDGLSRVEFLEMLRGAVGREFTGYKGGEFRMGRETPVWVSNYGECSGARIVGVEVEDDVAHLLVAVRRWK